MFPHGPTYGMCHKATYAAQQKVLLFDHLVGAREQYLRHFEAERPRCLHVDDEFKLGWLYDG